MEIKTKGLTRIFNGKAVLKDISLKLDNGKALAVIGPSGSGKTTLLRLLNLLDRPSSGRISFNGRSSRDLKSKELYELQTKMALVFQNPSLFQRSVEANVAYGLKIRLVRSDKIKKRVMKTLSAIGLKEHRQQFAPTLSAGEAQRVSFARAVVFKPEVLMLDEFTANLDPANVKMLEEAVVNYQRETNSSILLATHNFFQAKRLADEIIFLYNGRVVEAGEKNEFFSNPKEELTQDFLSGELIC